MNRLYQGREISSLKSKTGLKIEEHRASLKQKLNHGELSPWKILQAMSYTVGVYPSGESYLSDSEDGRNHKREIN